MAQTHDIESGCAWCGIGDRYELEAGAGVVLEGKSFHPDCMVEWMEDQGWTEAEKEQAFEQVYG